MDRRVTVFPRVWTIVQTGSRWPSSSASAVQRQPTQVLLCQSLCFLPFLQNHGNKCAGTHPPRTPAWPCGPPRWLQWCRRLSPPSASDGERMWENLVGIVFHLGRRTAINLSRQKNKDAELEGNIKLAGWELNSWTVSRRRVLIRWLLRKKQQSSYA